MTRSHDGCPAGGGRPFEPSSQSCDKPTVDAPSPYRSISAQLRIRRAAAWRLPPLPDGRRDPLDPPDTLGSRPSCYGLSRAGLAFERSRCRELGWQEWELQARFTDPEEKP